MTAYRKMIVWVAEEYDGETKDEVAKRLCRVIQASDIDLTANVHATEWRIVLHYDASTSPASANSHQ